MRDWDEYVRGRLSLPDLPREREARIVRELATQLEDFYRDAIARGGSEAEADADARRQIADWPRLAAHIREVDRHHIRSHADRWSARIDDEARTRGGKWHVVADLWRDVRYARRRLASRPGFTAVAIATLALGIGANAAIFSVVRAVLLEPLPYAEPHELVRMVGFDTEVGDIGNLSPADFLDFERETTTLERMGAHGWVGSFTVTGRTGDAERVGGVNVTEGFFPTLGVVPAVGRLFTRQDDALDAPLTVILSDGFWRRRFAADPAIVGTELLVNARPATVIGVLPASYRHLEPNPDRSADVFVPYGFSSANPNRGGHFIRGVGRRAPGASVQAAQAELAAIAARLEQQYPVSNHARGVRVMALHEAVVGDERRSLVILSAAVGCLLLIACANLANLLLAAGAARQREFAVRTAVGASRGQAPSRRA